MSTSHPSSEVKPEMIRCVRVHDLGKMRQEVLSLKSFPPLKAGHVRVAVEFAGCNFADVLVVKGQYQEKPKRPFIPGGQVAGWVMESRSEGFQVGDRVVALCMFGGYAECVDVPSARVWLVPERITQDTAATVVVNFGTSMMALRHGQDRFCEESPLEDRVLVVTGASGGTGSAAVLLGKALKMKVIALARGRAKTEHCRSRLGADIVADCQDVDMRRVVDIVRSNSGGRGADIVLDTVGGPFWPHLVRMVAWGGRIAIIGFASNQIPKIPANLLLVRNLDAQGIYFGGHFTKSARDLSFARDCVQSCLDLIEAGRIPAHNIVRSTFPLEQADTAHATIQRGIIGKVLLVASLYHRANL